MATLQRGGRAIESLPEITDIREVTRADLTHLQAPRPQNHIATLRDSHHRLARAVASGLTTGQVAETCGCSMGRVSRLKDDPSFIELVAHYRALLTEEWKETADPVNEYMRSNALKAEQLISDRLDRAMEEDETIPLSQLVQVTSDRYDRLGYSKVTKSVNVNMDFAANLEAARRRSSTANSRVIDLQPGLGAAGATPANQGNLRNVEAPGSAVKHIEASPSISPQSTPTARTPQSQPSGSSIRRFG